MLYYINDPMNFAGMASVPVGSTNRKIGDDPMGSIRKLEIRVDQQVCCRNWWGSHELLTILKGIINT